MIKEYIIENDFLRVKILNLGGIIKSIYFKEKEQECVVSYLDNNSYLNNIGSIGVGVTGPFAGRIDKGQFELNNKTVQLDTNFLGKHHLHGGSEPLGLVYFDVHSTPTKLTLTKTINNLNTNFHDLTIECSYEVVGNKLIQEIKAKSQEDVVFNPTNHTYFNFNKSKDILDYHLEIPMTYGWLLRDDMIPRERVEVNNSVFSPLKCGKINEVEINDSEFKNSVFIDHPFELDGNKITLKGEGIKLEIETTSKALVIYTGNVMDHIRDPLNVVIKKFMGVCLETQELPNIINMPERDRVIVSEERPFYKRDTYHFKGV